MLRYMTLSSLVLALFAFGCDDSDDTTGDDAGDMVAAGMDTPAGDNTPVAGMDMPVAGMDMPVAGDTAGTGVMPVAGESAGMDELRDMIAKVAPSEARVLITGPNGSGKELVAHQMHEQSVRSKNAMVEVNCAAIPAELIESELFGHKKGAFTGAQKDRKGKFELAHGGTLFLDEIGDMSLSAQAKVLRALQEHQITPVGGDRSIKVDVRVLAATNKDLRKEIELGKFREDLYHRLSVILIEVPGLNDRRDDIPLLAQHFLQQIADDYGVPAKTISVQAVSALQGYDWTGNIREFRNVIERLHILGGSEISATDVSTFARK